MDKNNVKNRRLIDLDVSELKEMILDSVSSVNPLGDEIMDIASCAKFLKKEPTTIYGYVSRKTIPFKKKNGSVYFLRSEILAWLKDE
jgi:predicted DNA-binding transcriptional regulator AlpA